MNNNVPQRVTELVRRLGDGEAAVADELLALVYEELRVVAQGLFRRQPTNHTLQPTALVHEAWIKLASAGQAWETRCHFFAVAAKAMRQVLTDAARARRAGKRDQGGARVTFTDELGNDNLSGNQSGCDLLDFEEALQSLAEANERYAKVVELRLLGGLTIDEIAATLDLHPRTIKLDWRAARAWLHLALSPPESL